MHIQDPTTAKELIPHWGYGDRVVPCINDAGTCAYLDALYRSHDLSMIYSFSFWAIIVGIFVIWIVARLLNKYSQKETQTRAELEGQRKSKSNTLLTRIYRTTCSFLHRHLYPVFPGSTFGHVSRLQVLVFAVISTYISIFSLIGITYKSWESPHKDNPSIIDTRTGFAGFADRVGVFAFALTPLTIFLSTRESVLTLITGISYQHFNFLHRWTGRLIFIQGSMHTFGWMVIKGCLYQPQPSTYIAFMIQPYIIWGCAAICFLVFLYVFSIKSVIEWTGYEFFLISHLLAAIMFVATCWKHWPKLACWMISSVIVLLLDFTLRMLYFSLIHFKLFGNQKGFKPAQSTVSVYDDPNGKVVRLDFEHQHRPWKAGQHFMLTFPALSVWQSHPFTTLSSPDQRKDIQKHSYIIRCQSGETKKLGILATTIRKTSVLLSGPYGTQSLMHQSPNILAISGGTGISYTIPIIQEAALQSKPGFLQLVWIIRRVQNLDWARPELEALRANPQVYIRILVTSSNESNRDNNSLIEDEKSNLLANKIGKKNDSLSSLSDDKRFEILYLNGRPVMEELIAEYLERIENDRVLVIGSGPSQMGMDVRNATAKFNDPTQVWRGNMKRDVKFYWDY
ncbi:Ferric/cupric reductase transmembrane component 2 [Erysiphe necator]|nr:Ferric/cupric reductase transmembrane component 2 [Erysiphe necator]